jgi:hypothetical protein
VIFANGLGLAWPSSKSAQVSTMPTNRSGSILAPDKRAFVDSYLLPDARARSVITITGARNPRSRRHSGNASDGGYSDTAHFRMLDLS